MTIAELRNAHKARPFKPFTICLSDGRPVSVPHPEFLLIVPGATRTFVVGTPRGTHRVIDLLHVTTLDFDGGKPRPRRKR